jgi:hypothetical protein
MPQSDRPPPNRQKAPKPPPRASSPGQPGGSSGGRSAKESDAPRVSLDESDFLWEDDEVTPLGGTPAFTAPPKAASPSGAPYFEPGDDPRPSPFERVTVAPPLPEREYVARMMGKLPEGDRGRRRGNAVPTPPPPTLKGPSEEREAEPQTPDEPPSGLLRRSTIPGFGPHSSERVPPSSGRVRASSSPERAEHQTPLVLDLTESVPPGALGAARGSEPRQRKAPTERTSTLTFGAAGGDALDLVGVRAQSKPPKAPAADVRQVRDRFDAGDFSGALIVAEGILSEDPDNADALLYAEHCRDVLKQMYLSRLGGLRRVPLVAIGPEQLRWLSLDHRAGFLLSLVDGSSTFDEVLDMSGMSDLEALRLLVQLLQQNVIKVS